jgi:hypothetical protein
MATMSTIPITVEPEAAARIDELGMRREFEEMLEQARAIMPDTRAIEVALESDPEELDPEPRIVITPFRPDPAADYDPLDGQWGHWFVRTFSPDVCRHFVLLSCYEIRHAG